MSHTPIHSADHTYQVVYTTDKTCIQIITGRATVVKSIYVFYPAEFDIKLAYMDKKCEEMNTNPYSARKS